MQLNVFSAMMSWRTMKYSTFQEMLHLLVATGAIGRQGTLWSYAFSMKTLVHGFCSLTDQGTAVNGAGEVLDAPTGMPRRMAPRVWIIACIHIVQLV